MSDELLKLPYAIRLARATLRNVKTNVAISLVLKAAFLVLAIDRIRHALDGGARRHRRHGHRRRERAATVAFALARCGAAYALRLVKKWASTKLSIAA